MSRLRLTPLDGARDDKINDDGSMELVVFLCGPNKSCDHSMDHYVDIKDSDGLVCGTTLACSKCGETSFNISMWE